jgi:drug/metabolite transporter (DMT)-like permease
VKSLIATSKYKGYFLAAFSAIAVSNVYIFSKAALRETDMVTFGFFWFLMAFSYNFIYVGIHKKLKLFLSYTPSEIRKLALIGLFEMSAAFFFFKGVTVIENPTIVSFLDNSTPIFVTILGILFLKDRFTKLEIFGMVLAVIGAFLVCYSGTFTLTGLFISGSQYAILAAILISIGITLAKRSIRAFEPEILSLTRTIFLLSLFFILMLINHKLFSITTKPFVFVSIGSFAGPFLAAVLQYKAFQYIEASKAMIIQSTRSFIVLLASFVIFGLFPLPHQLAGGIVAITGVMIITFGNSWLNSTKKNK